MRDVTTMAEREEILAVKALTSDYGRGWFYIAAGHFKTRDRILSDWRAGR